MVDGSSTCTYNLQHLQDRFTQCKYHCFIMSGHVFSYKLRYIVGFGLVEMAISTNPKPTIYRNVCENTAPDLYNVSTSS